MFLRVILMCFISDFAFSSSNVKKEGVDDVLETYVQSLHEKYTKRIDDLQNKFEEKFRIQDERIRIQDERINSLQNDLTEKTELVEHLSKKLNYVDQNVEVLMSEIEKSVDNSSFSTGDSSSVNTRIRLRKSDAKGSRIMYKSLRHDDREITRQGRLLLQDEAMNSSDVIAFYAYLSANLPSSNAGPNHVLVFDLVRTNIGNAYHPHTGVFIVPETGVYVFTWSLYNGGTESYHSLELVVNADVWGIIHAHSVAPSDYTLSTGTAVVPVNAGDDVFVRSSAIYAHGTIVSDKAAKTFFSGWKL